MSAEVRQSTRDKLVAMLRQTPEERLAEAEAKLAEHRAVVVEEGSLAPFASSLRGLMEEVLEREVIFAQMDINMREKMREMPARLMAKMASKTAELGPVNPASICPVVWLDAAPDSDEPRHFHSPRVGLPNAE